MRAYRVVAPDQCEFVEVPEPVVGAGEVALKVAAVGMCHSDVFIRAALPALRMPIPVTLGHEIVGHVDEIGAGVDGVVSGQRVAVYVLVGCGRCPACSRDQDNLCREGYRGIGTHLDGGLAERVVVPARNLVDASGIDPVDAAPLTDAALTALHTVRTALATTPHANLSVLVGVGGLGHLGVQALLAAGQRVVAVDVSEAKLDLARRLGAQHLVQAGPGAIDEILRIAGGRAVDVVTDFVGTDETLRLAQAVTNRGSAIAIAGLGGGSLTVTALSVTDLSPEVSVRRVSAGSLPELREVFDLARSGKLHADTEVFEFDEVPAALDRLHAGEITGRAVIRL